MSADKQLTKERSVSFAAKYSDFILIILFALPAFFVLPYISDFIAHSDKATNSILVDQAKNGVVLHGNYSRVGFYHPGPFFIYVMTFGEVFFHDLIPVFSSPYVAQNAGAAVYAALFFYFAFRILTSTGQPARLAAAFCITISIAMIGTTLNIVSSVWPPNLYVPAAFLLGVSAWAILTGSGLALVGFCLAGAALVHGHASNLGLVPIFTVLVALRLAMKIWLDKSFQLRIQRGHILWSIAIFIAFVTPFALHNLISDEPDLLKYFEYSDRPNNSLSEGLDFLGFFWSTWWGLSFFAIVAAGFCVAIYLTIRSKGRADPAQTHADAVDMVGPANVSALIDVVWVMAAFTVTLLYYAITKIDFLDQRYIAYWYYGAIGSCIAAAIFSTARIIENRYLWAKALCVLGALAFYFISYTDLERNRIREVTPEPAMAGTLVKEAKGKTSILIPLEGRLWRETAMLVDYFNRAGDRNICVMPDQWQVLYARQNLCSETDLNSAFKTGDIFYLSTLDETKTVSFMYPGSEAKLLDTFKDIHLYQASSSELVLDDNFTPEQPSNARLLELLTLDGFSDVKPHGVWMQDQTARIVLPFQNVRRGDVVGMNFAAYIPEEPYERTLTGSVNDEIVFRQTFTMSARNATVRFKVPEGVQDDAPFVLTLQVDNLLSPSQFGSGDTRNLAVSLQSIIHKPASN